VIEAASVDEAVGDVFGEDGDIFMVGAEVRPSFIVCAVCLDDRLFGVKTIVVCLKLFFFIELRVVGH
jgi:hypothetical protein